MWEFEYMTRLEPIDILALSGGLAIWIRRRGSLAGWLGSAAFLVTAVGWGLRTLIFESHDLMGTDPYIVRFWLPSLSLAARWCAFAAIVVVALREITEPRERRAPFSSARWLGRILGPLGVTVVLAPVLQRMIVDDDFTAVTAILLLLHLVALVVGVVYLAKFIYRIWAAIQDGCARTTPGRAVGFLFIPIFNLYWIFVAYWGWTRDFNRYVREKGLQAPRMHQGMTLTMCILALVALVPYAGMPISVVNLALLGVFVASACDGLSAIAPASEVPAGDTDAS